MSFFATKARCVTGRMIQKRFPVQPKAVAIAPALHWRHHMDKELYAAAGFALALIVSAILGHFFTGFVLGLAGGYSIADRGEMVRSVWTKLHPHLHAALSRARALAGSK
jgi:hypothetical protein